MNVDPRELATLAAKVAVTAGKLAATGRAADVANDGYVGGVVTKSSATDVVTRHDKAAEQSLVHDLLRTRPDDTIVGEEGTDHLGTSGVSWYLDPIDGTTNFLYGLPAWCVSVGAADETDTVVAGAVYAPVTDELFIAAAGHGATRNGVPIRANAESNLALALVATGFGYTPERRAVQAARFTKLAPAVRDLRRGGSAALDLCYTAAGFLDAYFEEHLNRWDMAAGELIAREAGCRTGDFTGGPGRPEQLLVAAPALFDTLAEVVAASGARRAE